MRVQIPPRSHATTWSLLAWVMELVFMPSSRSGRLALMKYTKEVLSEVVASTRSFAATVRALGLKPNCGTQSYIASRIRSFGIDTGHFTGKRTNSGPNHRGGPEKKHWAVVLVNDRNGGKKEQTYRLRRALIESGTPYVCSVCSGEPVWNNKPLRLQVDRIDGNVLNNEKQNVRFVCPNCHSQTDTWGIRNKK